MNDDLITMDMLVYECYLDDSVTLEHFQAMQDIDKVHLLMSTVSMTDYFFNVSIRKSLELVWCLMVCKLQSTEHNFVKNVRRWLIPFLYRCAKHHPGQWYKLLHTYLTSLAVHDLSLCLKVFQNSLIEQPDPIISDVSQIINLALDCIYICEETTQLENSIAIVNCLPQRGFEYVVFSL